MTEPLAPAPVPVSIAAPTPVQVEIAAPTPVPVQIIGEPRRDAREALPSQPSMHIQRQSIDPSLPAKTTFQEDLVTASQRRVNLIWEYTQATIALMVVAMTMVCGAVGMIKDLQIPTIISVAFGMITGFYFSRTNHEKIGGTGAKASSTYEGR